MANKNFEVKHGLSVGGTERITSAGVGSFPSLSTSGNLTVGGNLTVTGSTTTADNLVSADKNITLNYHASNDTSGSADGAGITIQDAVDSSTDATLLWDASSDIFKMSHGLQIPKNLHIRNTASEATALIFENTNNAQALNIDYYSNAGAAQSRISYDEGPAAWNFIPNVSNSNSALYINYSGNVGVGTTSLTSKFTVEGDIRQTDGDLLYAGGGNWDIKHLTNDQNIVFYTSQSGNAAEKMRVQANGYVGIGTSSPDARLTVSGAANSEQMIITGNNNQSRGLSISTRTNNGGSGGQQDAEVFLNAQDTEHNSYGAVALGYAGNEVLRVQQIESSGATGAVGINEVSPAYTLDVNTSGESNAFRIYQGTNSKDCSMLLQNQGTSSGDDTLIQLYTAAGAGDAKIRWAISGNETWEMGIDNDNSDALKISNGSALGTDDRMRMAGSTVAWTTTNFTIQNAGDPTTVLTNTSANQTLRLDHNSIRTTTNHNLSLLVNALGNRKLMLKSSGTNNAANLVGIGGTSSPTATLHVQNLNSENNSSDGIIYVAKNSGNDWSCILGSGSDDYGIKLLGYGSNALVACDHNNSGNVRARISHNGYIYSTDGSIHDIDSDVRLKEEITAAPSQWNIIKGLPLQKFKWKDRRHGENWDYGWIAQVVEETNPEFVEDAAEPKENVDAGITTDFKTVKTGDIQRRSIAALQEAMNRIETLEAQVSQNLSDINLLKSRIEVLEG